MFPTLGLFHKLPCPEKAHCQRPSCLFSHSPEVTEVPVIPIPVDVPKPAAPQTPPQPAASSSKTPSIQAKPAHVMPAKRSIGSPLQAARNGTLPSGPPSKLQRVGTPQRPVAVPTLSYTSVGTRYMAWKAVLISIVLAQEGVPLLKVNAAASQVALPVRQVRLSRSLV